MAGTDLVNNRPAKASMASSMAAASSKISLYKPRWKAHSAERHSVALIAKSDIPAPVLEALEKAAAKEAEVALEKSAKEALPHFDVEVAKSLVKADLGEKVMEALKSADALLAGKMEEVGKGETPATMSSAQEALDDFFAAG